MARPLRIEYDGTLYHVTSRVNARQSIFAGDEDRKIFLATLAKVNDKYNFLCHAYCLMNNHYLCEASHNITIYLLKLQMVICKNRRTPYLF